LTRSKISEHDIQNHIRESLNPYGRFFRINVGVAWAGNDIENRPDGSKLIKDPRPFATFGTVQDTKNLKGFSDIFGVVPVIVTPEMVDKKIGIATFIEVKGPRGRVSEEQNNFLTVMSTRGCRTGVVRSVEDAIKIVGGNQSNKP